MGMEALGADHDVISLILCITSYILENPPATSAGDGGEEMETVEEGLWP